MALEESVLIRGVSLLDWLTLSSTMSCPNLWQPSDLTLVVTTQQKDTWLHYSTAKLKILTLSIPLSIFHV